METRNESPKEMRMVIRRPILLANQPELKEPVKFNFEAFLVEKIKNQPSV